MVWGGGGGGGGSKKRLIDQPTIPFADDLHVTLKDSQI